MSIKALRRFAPLLVVASLAAGLFYFWGPGNAQPAFSFGGYQASLPNGDTLFNNTANFAGSNSCLLCHGWNASTPGSILSSGTAGYLTSALKPFSMGAAWGGHAAAALADMDGDGFTNGEELQDPAGAWTPGAGTTNFGDQAFVSNPNWNQKYPPAPIISSLSGLASGATVSGKVAVNVALRYAGLSRVVYTFTKTGLTRDFAVASPAITNYAAAYCLGAATAQAGACPAWDSSALPDGVYAVTVTAYDKLAAGLGGPRTAALQLTNVTIQNAVVVPPPATVVPPTATPVPPTETSIPYPPPDATSTDVPPTVAPPTATPIVPPTSTPIVPPTATPIVPSTSTPVVPPTLTPPPTGGPVTYVVQAGDTLFRIARRFGTTVRAIQIANGIRGTWIRVGQTLVIPGANPAPQPTPRPTEESHDQEDHHEGAPTEWHGSDDQPRPAATETHSSESEGKPKTYTVKAGDNLFRIGLRFGVSVGAIQAANGLRTIYIQVGQVLVIP
jgi:LysM repeat protein